MTPSRIVSTAAAVAVACTLSLAVSARDFRVEDVATIAGMAAGQPPVGTIAFTDHRKDELVDPVSGLIRFADWARARPLQKQLLALYPGYEEPTVSVTLNGVTRMQRRRLHMYVAEARFQIPRPAETIDLSRFISLAAIERMDPAIKHRLIRPADIAANQDARLSAHNPARRWCESDSAVICIQSRYQLEGKLPAAVMLLNKLRDTSKHVDDFLDFQSELRVIPAAEIDQEAFAKLTGIDAPVASALEQNIVQVNQVMQFGKFLAILQPSPEDPGRTIASAFVALAVESDLFEKRKELEGVPVLRNMVPAQVLAGNSSFNTGTSISGGLPNYSRNRMKAIAAVLAPD